MELEALFGQKLAYRDGIFFNLNKQYFLVAQKVKVVYYCIASLDLYVVELDILSFHSY